METGHTGNYGHTYSNYLTYSGNYIHIKTFLKRLVLLTAHPTSQENYNTTHAFCYNM